MNRVYNRFMFKRQNLLLALWLTLATTAAGAQASALTVDDVLARVRANVSEFKSSVPSFICDESVISQRLGDGKVKDEMKIESSFEMARKPSSGDLVENRIKNRVNGKAPKSQKVVPPFYFIGGFANVVGFTLDKCFSYRFAEPPADSRPIVIAVTPKPQSADPSSTCIRQDYDRKAVIDPGTFQITRIEETVRNVSTGIAGHVPFVPVPSSHNVLTFAIDYAPLELGGRTFWVTKTVTADLEDKNKPLRLHYEAHYTNYHRFAGTSTILAGEADKRQN
jgi:hypothetical protein